MTCQRTVGASGAGVLIEGVERVVVRDVRPDAEAGMAGSALSLGTTQEDPGLIERLDLDLRSSLKTLIETDPTLPSGLARLTEHDTDPARLAERSRLSGGSEP